MTHKHQLISDENVTSCQDLPSFRLSKVDARRSRIFGKSESQFQINNELWENMYDKVLE